MFLSSLVVETWIILHSSAFTFLNAGAFVIFLFFSVVFFAHSQRASMAWSPATMGKEVVSLLLPGSIGPDEWLPLRTTPSQQESSLNSAKRLPFHLYGAVAYTKVGRYGQSCMGKEWRTGSCSSPDHKARSIQKETFTRFAWWSYGRPGQRGMSLIYAHIKPEWRRA